MSFWGVIFEVLHYLTGFLKPLRLPTLQTKRGQLMSGSRDIGSSHQLLAVRLACLQGQDSLTGIQTRQPSSMNTDWICKLHARVAVGLENNAIQRWLSHQDIVKTVLKTDLDDGFGGQSTERRQLHFIIRQPVC